MIPRLSSNFSKVGRCSKDGFGTAVSASALCHVYASKSDKGHARRKVWVRGLPGFSKTLRRRRQCQKDERCGVRREEFRVIERKA
jgi:hypothetical protein